MDAERMERAARALLDAASRIEAETMCVVPRRLVDALRAALAAPEPAQAGRDVHTWERPSRVWVVAWPNARSAHFTEEARDHAAEPMPNGSAPVMTEYVPSSVQPAQAGEAVAWHRVQDGDTVIVGGRKITMRVEPFRADPHPSRPGGAAQEQAGLVDAATYAMNDTARILSMGGVQRVEDIEIAKQGIVARAVAHALRGAGSEVARTDGCALIAAERRRQVEKEGWTHEHDDEHADGALRVAAAFLAAEGTDAEVTMPDYEASWIEALVKKHGRDHVRSLVIAGALIAAELDRLLRAAAPRDGGAA